MNLDYIKNLNIVRSICGHIKRDGKIILISLIVGFVVTFGVALYTSHYSYRIQSNIAGGVLRFHVLANSDAEYDQALKLNIRNRILTELSTEIDPMQSRFETKEMLYDNLGQIVIWAENEIEKNGYSYTVTAKIENILFPSRTYGNATFPSGYYEALKIKIGDAKGQNWWCIMFPPLCFVDVVRGEISDEDREMLRDILTEEEFAIVVKSNEGEIVPSIRLKVVEWWQNRR